MDGEGEEADLSLLGVDGALPRGPVSTLPRTPRGPAIVALRRSPRPVEYPQCPTRADRKLHLARPPTSEQRADGLSAGAGFARLDSATLGWVT